MKMNRHISCAVRFLGVAAACLVLSFASSCTREDPAGDDAARLSADAFAFDLLDEEQDVLTRSVFDNVSGWSDSKKSNVTLAAYCGGVLFAKQYYSSGITAMTLSLEKGRTYNVYALVNMGDMTSSIPDSESGSGGIASLVYNIPSYNSGSNSVSSYGIPMAGVLENLSVTASTSGTQHVPVKRLLARVTLNLTCNWPGAQIQSAKVYNLNRRLVPFGSSVAQSSSDILSGFQELTTASSPGSTLTAVMYVPENLQGTISGASTSGNKRPDAGISGITNKQSVLSYMEVYVTGASPLSGNVTYRSYLGSNATNNFDIVRNTKYVWNLTYQASGLQTDNWKVDSDITDNRRIILNGPFYLERSETLAWSSVVNTETNQTNIALSDLSYSFTGSQASSIVSSTSGSNLSTASAISVRSNAPIGQTATLTVTPSSNPNNIITGAAISGQTQVNVIDRVVEWKNYDQSVYGSENKKVYVVDAGSSVTAEVDFSYMWPATNGTQYFERGMRPSKWTYTTPSTGSGTSAISSSYTAGSGNTRDRITYSVGSAVAYGDYAVTVSRTSPQTGSDQAYIRVADTRYLRWVDQSSAAASDANVSNYVFTSDREVHLYLERGSAYTLRNASFGGSGFNPFRFNFGDAGGEHRIKGVNITGMSFVNYMDYDFPTAFSWSSPTVGDSQSYLNFNVRSNLSTNQNGMPFRLRFNGESQGQGHEIVMYVHVTPQITRQLEVAWASHDGVLSNSSYQESPARGDIYAGTNTAQLEARLYEYEDGVKSSRYTVVSSGVTWSVYSGSQYLSVNSSGRVTGSAVGTGVIRASATVNGTSYNTNDTNRQAQVSVVADQITSYGNPTLTLSYNPNPVAVGGGTSTPTVTYTQSVTYASGNTGSISGTVTSFNSWSGSATGFTLNSSTGVVTAASNMGNETTTYGNPTLSLSYSGTPIAYTGGSATPTVTYTQQRTVSRASTNQRSITVTVNATVNGKSGSASATVTQQRDAGASASTTQLSGTVGDSSSSFDSWSGSATGFSVNGSTGVVTAASNAGGNTTTYSNLVLSLSYSGTPIAYTGGDASPSVTYTQDKTESRLSTTQRSITVTVNATVNGKAGSASATVTQSRDTGTSGTTTQISGTVTSFNSWSGSATGFSLNGTSGVVTASSNAGGTTTTYGNPVVSLSYNPSSFGVNGGTAVPTWSYTQSVTQTRSSTNSRSINVRVTATVNGQQATSSQVGVIQSGDQGATSTMTETSGGTATWHMNAATGFSQNSSNGNITVAQNNTSSSRSTQAWVTVTAHSKSGNSSNVTISQSAGTTTYRYRVRVVRASAPNATTGTTSSNRQELEFGYNLTLKASLYRYTFVNGTEQSNTETLITDSAADFVWSSSDSSKATVSGGGVVTATGIGDVNIMAAPRGSYDLIDGNGVYYIRVVSGGGGLDPGYD